MPLQRLVKLALLTLALSLPLSAPSARADDEPSDPRTVVLKTYDVRDLGVTNDDLTELRNNGGAPWKPSQVSMRDGVLIVRGSAAEHEVLERWLRLRRLIAARDREAAEMDRELARARALLEGAEAGMREAQAAKDAALERTRALQQEGERLTMQLATEVSKRLAQLAAQASDLARQREAYDRQMDAVNADGVTSEGAARRLADLTAARLHLDEEVANIHRLRRELESALEILRGPDSEARRKAVEELRRVVPLAEPGYALRDAQEGAAHREGWRRLWYLDNGAPVSIEDAARKHIDRLAAQGAALEGQQAELQRRAAVITDLASRLEANEPEKRKSLDSELVRIDQAAAELTAKREALQVQKTQLESALAEKRYDELREHLAKLEAEAREREASRSARWPQANTSQGPIPENEILLEEVRALRRDVREVKALLRKLLERDGVAVDPRGAR